MQNLDISTLFLTPDSNVLKKFNPDPHIVNTDPQHFAIVSISIPLDRNCVEQRLRNNLQCCIPLPGPGTAASKVNTILNTAPRILSIIIRLWL
jgi:hypothetical protein